MPKEPIDFTREEEVRNRLLTKIKGLSSITFNPDKWAEIKSEIYKVLPLDVEIVMDDTTLREGLQMAELSSPTAADMAKIASLLKEAGVERIETVTYSPSDQKAIQMMRDEGLGDMLAGWSRAVREDVDICLKLDLKQTGISHPVSYIHFEKWMDTSLKTLLDRVVDTVEYAVDHGLRVFVHGEDSTRADWNFEKKFINAVAEAGAEVYRVCDTVGCGISDPKAPLPQGIPRKIRKIKEETSISAVEIHAHDDLGNAVENTMAAIRASSGLYKKFYASTTFLGIGDRAGNAETEKVITNLYMHHGIDKWNLKPFRAIANFVANSLNYHLPLNKAIVGDGAFAHESGIHVFGVKTLPLTYEVFPPELVGHERAIIIGKRSGKHGIQMKLEELMGMKVEDDDPRLLEMINKIKNDYLTDDRRHPFSHREFRDLASKVGFEVKR